MALSALRLTENPMLDKTHHHTRAGTHEILADRLFQLAGDTDRVGLHREATILASFAASVLEGRPFTVRDA